MSEFNERLAEWEKRRCCCVFPDADHCIADRCGYTENEVELPSERCECYCHAIWAVEDWVNDYVPFADTADEETRSGDERPRQSAR